MNAALVARFLRLIPEANRTAFEENQLTNNPKMRFLQVFDYFWDNYGDASEEEIVENTAKLLDPGNRKKVSKYSSIASTKPK